MIGYNQLYSIRHGSHCEEIVKGFFWKAKLEKIDERLSIVGVQIGGKG
jgi:hypothetical protein